MSSLMDRIKKNTTIKASSVLSDSSFFDVSDLTQTTIPAVNIALSGSADGGFGSGLILWAGPSKHFKTNFTLLMMKAYLDKYPEAIALFYDSEFGTPQSYFESFGIDTSRVMHTPVANIEEFKFDIMKQLEEIKKGDRVFIALDSAGNIASKKEVDDAMEGKSVADMTRAKSLKSCFRMITPHLTLKQIPMVVVNHTYQTQEMFSKAVVSGGCLIPGTKIKMSDGSLKSVEDILVGENVITLDGDKPVTYTWTPETLDDGEPECYKVTFDDGTSVTCSETHKFLVGDSWVEAKDLVADLNVIVLS